MGQIPKRIKSQFLSNTDKETVAEASSELKSASLLSPTLSLINWFTTPIVCV